MSAKDRDRLKTLHAVSRQHITQVQAARELGVSRRWVRALLQRMKQQGDGGVVHGLRGRASNRKLPATRKQRVLERFAEPKRAKQWPDYGPTLAAEELANHYQLVVSKETLRQWLIAAQLWKPQRARINQIHSALWRTGAVGYQ
jgi:DNA-binding Lrp family transcriptional regulator